MVDPVSTLDRPRFFIPDHSRTIRLNVSVLSGLPEFLQPAKRTSNFRWVTSINNWLLSSAGERACQRILQEIAPQVANTNLGFLVRINAEEGPDGLLRAGPGAFVTPMGLGRDPTDVLAEDFRKPQWAPAPNPSLRNASWYCWISDVGDGSLYADSQTPEASRAIRANARREAELRNVMGEFLTGGPPTGIYRAQRAEYWLKVSADHYRLERGREAYLRMDRLNREMAAAQSLFNDAYENYQTTLAEMARQQSRAEAMQRIGIALELISIGANVAAARAERAARAAQEEAVQLRLDQLTARHAEQALQMRDRLQQIEVRLQNMWSDWGVSLPQADPIPRYRIEGGRLVPELP